MKRYGLCFLAVGLLAVLASCKHAEDENIYYSLSEIEHIMSSCKTSDDVRKVFGEPTYSQELDNAYVLWIYSAPIEMDVQDGVSGFSVRMDQYGSVLRWDPTLSSRTNGIR